MVVRSLPGGVSEAEGDLGRKGPLADRPGFRVERLLDGQMGRRKKGEQSAEAALAALELPVTREWEEAIERERAESARRIHLEDALSRAARLWEAGCYRDYVAELSPFRGQLSPARLKRLEIAEKRASGDELHDRPG